MTEIITKNGLIRFLAVGGGMVCMAFLPFAFVIIGGVIADVFECEVNEADVHPCIILGVDIGELLYFMLMMGWLGIATVILGVWALALWAAIGFVILGRNMYKRHQERKGVGV